MNRPVVRGRDEDGWTVAQCPVLPGCVSLSRTREEALASLREAIGLRLESRAEEGRSLPAEYEVVDLAVAE